MKNFLTKGITLTYDNETMGLLKRMSNEAWLLELEARKLRNEKRSKELNKCLKLFKPRTVLRKKNKND